MTTETGKTTTTPFSVSVLVAEDDGPSGLFLKAAFESVGCRATLAVDGAQALALARRQCFDLLLLDCRMPHAGATDILMALRNDPDAASHAAPAVATSAELDTALKAHLTQAGFADTLAKPTTLTTLRELAKRLLPTADAASAALLDDAMAHAYGGTADVVEALRGLFLRDLYLLANELENLAIRPLDLAERLHRLLASCGLCGAHALTNASKRLKGLTENGAKPLPSEIERFRRTLLDTIHALDDRVEALS